MYQFHLAGDVFSTDGLQKRDVIELERELCEVPHVKA